MTVNSFGKDRNPLEIVNGFINAGVIPGVEIGEQPDDVQDLLTNHGDFSEATLVEKVPLKETEKVEEAPLPETQEYAGHDPFEPAPHVPEADEHGPKVQETLADKETLGIILKDLGKKSVEVARSRPRSTAAVAVVGLTAIIGGAFVNGGAETADLAKGSTAGMQLMVPNKKPAVNVEKILAGNVIDCKEVAITLNMRTVGSIEDAFYNGRGDSKIPVRVNGNEPLEVRTALPLGVSVCGAESGFIKAKDETTIVVSRSKASYAFTPPEQLTCPEDASKNPDTASAPFVCVDGIPRSTATMKELEKAKIPASGIKTLSYFMMPDATLGVESSLFADQMKSYQAYLKKATLRAIPDGLSKFKRSSDFVSVIDAAVKQQLAMHNSALASIQTVFEGSYPDINKFYSTIYASELSKGERFFVQPDPNKVTAEPTVITTEGAKK